MGYVILDYCKFVWFTFGNQYQVACWLTIDYVGVFLSLQSWLFAARYYISYQNCTLHPTINESTSVMLFAGIAGVYALSIIAIYIILIVTNPTLNNGPAYITWFFGLY